MPINRGTPEVPGETIFTLRDPEEFYTHDEICDLLEAAEKLGFDLDGKRELDNLTVRELDILVHRRQ